LPLREMLYFVTYFTSCVCPIRAELIVDINRINVESSSTEAFIYANCVVKTKM